MPNIHYFTVNMAPFGMTNKDEVLLAKYYGTLLNKLANHQ